MSEKDIPVEWVEQYKNSLRKLIYGKYHPDEVVEWLLNDWKIHCEQEERDELQ